MELIIKAYDADGNELTSPATAVRYVLMVKETSEVIQEWNK